MLRGATVVCALLLAGSVRVVKKREGSNTSVGASGNLSKRSGLFDVDAYLKDVDERVPNHVTLGRDLLKDVGSINWTRGDIGEQLAEVAKSRGVNLAQHLADTVHPVVGIVFSVIASLFGWRGTKATKTAEEILREVRGLISHAKNELRAEFAESQFMTMMDHIDAAVNIDKWKTIIDKFRDRYRDIFYLKCWDNNDPGGCKGWRVQELPAHAGDGGMKALLLELKFSELMIHSGAALMGVGLMTDQFTKDIVKAAEQTFNHFHEYSTERVKWGSAKRGLKVGSNERLHPHHPERPNCGWMYQGYNCPDYFLTDEFLGGLKVCDYPMGSCDAVIKISAESLADIGVNSSHEISIESFSDISAGSLVGSCEPEEIYLEKEMNACKEARKVLIQEELDTIFDQAFEAIKTARSLQAGHYASKTR